jgi:predicted RND superfamily exporter protein
MQGASRRSLNPLSAVAVLVIGAAAGCVSDRPIKVQLSSTVQRPQRAVAILLVDHTNLLRRRDGMPLREAIEEAGRRRLRPILMTALTTVLALVPLALGMGEGGEAQAPLARAVIGGLTSSTLITLVLVPVVYSLFESLSLHRRKAARAATGEQGTGSGDQATGHTVLLPDP